MDIIQAILSTPVSIVIFLVGFVLIFVEMLEPGFGISGGLGLACLIIGIILTADTFAQAVIMGLIILAVIALMIVAFLFMVKRGRFNNTLFLKTKTDIAAGFTSTGDYKEYIGLEGVSQTVLRPAGKAIFGDIRLDVVTSGEYIVEGRKVKIIETVGNRIVVAEVTE